ncbi:glutathione S-transferase [uncultured Methylophaga sp.]|jgi:glutathione S-transferase|uniref:glutathione S-transferase n=1 Tax=uncultured Methylophaga sp. TaxID=285271 RepID=UPI0030DA6AEB
MSAKRPILYSFRRCPYAMRARLAIAIAGCEVELREVVLKDKPAELLEISPKATVPVLLENNNNVIEESLDIMLWAASHHAIWESLDEQQHKEAFILIEENDVSFKQMLDRYKYADRYPEQSEHYYREQGEQFLAKLENRLHQQTGLMTDSLTLVDFALLPFIRQFALVDWDWFSNADYPKLQNWLNGFLQSDLFKQVMHKYPQWQTGDEITVFPVTQQQ